MLVAGILVPRLKYVDDTVAHLMDAIKALKSSYQSLIRKLHTNPATASNPRPAGIPPAVPVSGSDPMQFGMHHPNINPSTTDGSSSNIFTPVDPVPPPNECGGEGSHWVDGHKFLRYV